jgi:Plasmid pRiA4b ORF-3-like protein
VRTTWPGAMFISMTKPAELPPSPRRGRSRTPHNLVLHVTVADIEPAIWRQVRVPDSYTLHQLHRVFQLLFGWQDYHLYCFRIAERRFEEPHPEAEAEAEPSTRFRLRDFKFDPGDRFTYSYDFGDGWQHAVVVEKVLPMQGDPAERLPELLTGARAGPHEDSGGPHGYEEMAKALRNKRSPEHRGYRDWAGPLYDPERFDPWLAGQNLVLAAAWGAI